MIAEGGSILELNAFSQDLRASSPADDLVSRTNFSVDLALAYQISDHLSVNAGYAHGLGSHLNYEVDQKDFSNLHRYFRMGLAYSF